MCSVMATGLSVCMQVWPGEFGQPLPWNFPFRRSYWQPKTAEPAAQDESSEQQALAHQLDESTGQ